MKSLTKLLDMLEFVWNWWKDTWNRMVYAASTVFPPLAQWRVRIAKKCRQLAVNAYNAEDKPLAIRYLQKAIDYAPRDPSFYCDLGQIYYGLGQFPDAEKQFKKALKYDYSDLRALKGLAYTLHARKNLSEAVYVYLRYLQDNEKDADVLLNLGAALQDSGNYVEALRYYGKAEKLYPENPVIPENRARTLYAMGKIEDAIGNLHRALKLNPDNPELHSLLGRALEANGNREQALTSYQAALQRDPTNARLRLDVSKLLDVMGRYKEAIEQATAALKALEETRDAEGLARAYWELGWSYFRLEQWGNSIQASRNALGVDPNLFQARFNLALALLHEGLQEEASEQYQRGAQDASSPVDLKYWAMDDLEEALEKRRDLPGGKEILRMLHARYDALRSVRSPARTVRPV